LGSKHIISCLLSGIVVIGNAYWCMIDIRADYQNHGE